jgi:hypothetical protein
VLNALLQNDELQQVLKDEDCQDLICGIFRMVEVGRNHTQLENCKHYVCMLETVSDKPADFMYLYLRNHPILCDRTRSIATQQQRDSANDDHTSSEGSTRKRKKRDG